MSLKRKIRYVVNDPLLILFHIVESLRYVIPDKLYLHLRFFSIMRKFINFKNPITYSEKLQWIKLYDRNPQYTVLVDKYKSKEYVKNIIGDGHCIPFLGIYESFDEIDFNLLPNQFVIKCSHNCGVVICKNKSIFDIKSAKKIIDKTMANNYFYYSREWPYKNVPRKVIVEKYMVDESGVELKDYKFFCFNGEPKFFFIATDRDVDTKFDFFDMDFNHLDIIQGHPNATKPIVKPANFDEMIRIARILSKGLRHVRIDLYNVNGNIFFGEYTFFHFGGMVPFVPEKWDKTIGEYLDLKI